MLLNFRSPNSNEIRHTEENTKNERFALVLKERREREEREPDLPISFLFLSTHNSKALEGKEEIFLRRDREEETFLHKGYFFLSLSRVGITRVISLEL